MATLALQIQTFVSLYQNKNHAGYSIGFNVDRAEMSRKKKETEEDQTRQNQDQTRQNHRLAFCIKLILYRACSCFDIIKQKFESGEGGWPYVCIDR